VRPCTGGKPWASGCSAPGRFENAVDVAFDLERWDAEDCDVVEVVFELADEDDDEDFDEEPHPAAAMERPRAARRASFLSMVLMMSDRALPFPTIGARVLF
jgi:hypothetical protein